MKKLLVLLFIFSIFISCSDDDPGPGSDNDEPTLNETINDWIYDVMSEVYYWIDDIPTNISTDQDPSAYFYQLLSEKDRFSVIYPDYQELINSLSGIELEAGYEFALVLDRDYVLHMLVTYVKPNSSASTSGLQRGDQIDQINGTSITLDNYETVLEGIYSDHTISYSRYDDVAETYLKVGTADLNVTEYAENPILLDSVYHIEGQKLGYLVYNFFSDGGAGSGFDDQVDQVFADFKAEGVNDLILDLRYNSGGSILSATNLASLIAPGVSSSDVFYRNQWNELYTNYWQNEPDGNEQLIGYFSDETDNIGALLGSNVYILTGSRTASASELVINGLDSYMNVTIIGDTTVGKNVGSIPFEDNNNPQNDYGILPIVIKLANADGFSDYGNGFFPTGDNLINEYSYLLVPFGDTRDPLLARAVELITGNPMNGRKQAANEIKKVLGSSLDDKPRSGKAIMSRTAELEQPFE